MFKTISHIIFTIIFFILSVGVNISQHYSNGKLYSQSIFGQTKSCNNTSEEICDMADMATACEMHKNQKPDINQQEMCSCEDTSEYLHIDESFTFPKKLLVDNDFEVISVFLNSFIYVDSIKESLLNNKFQLNDFGISPPKIHDYTSFYQVFRC